MGQNYNDISGMLLLDKPCGITSFKAVSSVRKILNVKKVGHCGTLDPAATGLLLVMVGKATKLQDKFMKKDKVYLSSFLFGTVTDTGDLDGQIVSQKSFLDININKIESAMEQFKGEILQKPPMYSALKYNGKKLYEFARQGIEIERPLRKVVVRNMDIISYDNGILNLKIECSSGTYIRTLAQDLGDVLGCGATVKSLRRERIDRFDIKDALEFEHISDMSILKDNLISCEELINE